MAERPAVLQRLARVSDVSQLLLPIATLATALWLWWAHYRTHDASAHGQAKRQPTGRALSAQELHKGDFSAADWAGPMPDEALMLLEHITSPAAFRSCTLSRQILLVGPPGTGKTKFARILCNQIGGEYYELNAAELDEIYVGVGSTRLRSLFREAMRANEVGFLTRCYYALTNTTPVPRPVVIFIDELDVLGRRMHGIDASVTHGTISQLLTLLDSLAEHPHVFFVGSTNHRHLIDEALLRAGRITQEIYFNYPTTETRQTFLRSLLRSLTQEDAQLYVNEEDVLHFVAAPGTEFWTIEDARSYLDKAIKRARQRKVRALREDDSGLVTAAVEVTRADLEYSFTTIAQKQLYSTGHYRGTSSARGQNGHSSSSETTTEELD